MMHDWHRIDILVLSIGVTTKSLRQEKNKSLFQIEKESETKDKYENCIVASPHAQNNIDEVIVAQRHNETGTVDPAHGWRASVARRIVKGVRKSAYCGRNTGL